MPESVLFLVYSAKFDCPKTLKYTPLSIYFTTPMGLHRVPHVSASFHFIPHIWSPSSVSHMSRSIEMAVTSVPCLCCQNGVIVYSCNWAPHFNFINNSDKTCYVADSWEGNFYRIPLWIGGQFGACLEKFQHEHEDDMVIQIGNQTETQSKMSSNFALWFRPTESMVNLHKSQSYLNFTKKMVFEINVNIKKMSLSIRSFAVLSDN